MSFFRTNKSTRALILIMIVVVLIGYFIARIYYGNINRSVDPRVVPARELYAGYDELANEGNYHEIFKLLDSVEAVYQSYTHYQQSFELGVIYNNRAAAYITISLYRDSIPVDYNPFINVSNDSLLQGAGHYINKAISIYYRWLEKYGSKTEEEITELIEDDFISGMTAQEPDLISRYLESRAEEIVESVKETERRLSVCYTNLGVVRRQQEKYEEAVKCYEKALELWDRNLSAENNLNILLGRPLKKRNIIQKLFPPER